MRDEAARPPRESWSRVGDAIVHAWECGPLTAQRGTVVLLPGLGLPRYLHRVSSAVGALGLRSVLLDLPGFGRRAGSGVAPDIDEIGGAAAAWVRRHVTGPVVVAGHSTAAQAALAAGLLLQECVAPLAVVLGAPTFRPPHRRWGRLLLATPAAYRRDPPSELLIAAPDLLRGHRNVVRVLLSGMADAPEESVRGLTVPLVLTAGRLDTYAPGTWLHTLRAAALRSPSVRVVQLEGSHNNPYTRPAQVARVLCSALP